MAKLSLINREQKREATVRKFAAKRALSSARLADASPVRLRNRCGLTGRPRGTFRKFGLARGMIRDAAMRGDIPGLIKASW